MEPVLLKAIVRLTREQCDAIASYGARTMWPAGFSIYEDGAPADGLFIVLRGQVVLRSPVSTGRCFVPWVATPGETFGGEGLEAGTHHAHQARAEEESETLHLTTSRVSALMREQPATALALLRQVMLERTELLDKFAQHATLTVEQRLVVALVRLAQSRLPADAVDGNLPVAVSRRLLGELVGATRESISLVLGRLAADGLIRRDGSALTILDREGLLARLAHQTRRSGIVLFDDRRAVGRDATA